MQIILKLGDPDSCYPRHHRDSHCKNVWRSNGMWQSCSDTERARMSQCLRRLVLGHVAEWLRNGLQNRVPRFNSGRGLQITQRSGPAPGRESRSSQDGLFQQRCLQTSWSVVHLRLQVLELDAAGFVATAAVVGMQEFWQFIACVSQLI